MVELALARKDRGVCSPLARTAVPGIHACQAERSSEQLAKGFDASSIADTCRQLHTTVGSANEAKHAQGCHQETRPLQQVRRSSRMTVPFAMILRPHAIELNRVGAPVLCTLFLSARALSTAQGGRRKSKLFPGSDCWGTACTSSLHYTSDSYQ